MKYIFRILLTLVLVLGLQGWLAPEVGAQSMTMTLDGEVVLQPQDMDATAYYPEKDQNDNLCALLKVTVTNKLKNPLVLETGGLAVQQRMERENGEIWFWVPYQVKNLHFSCSEYKAMSPIPVRLEKGKVYRLTLRTDAQVETVMNAAVNFAFMKLQIEPADAANAFVSIGKTQEYEVEANYAEGNLFTSSLPLDYGTYYYKVEHEYFATVEGQIELTAAAPKQVVTLQPAYGVLKITSEPAGAVLAIDGKRVGTTPWTSAKLPAGTVQVRLQAQNHALLEETLQVLGDGSEQSHHLKMMPQFGTVTCRSEMADAEIWVDQEYKGVGSWTGTLSSQAAHLLEARKAGHKAQSISFSVASGETKTEVVKAPVPMYGTLVLSTTPADVRVSIDGETMGETPLEQRLLVGKHTVVLKKEGYEDLSFEVTLAHNQRLDEKRTLAKHQLASKQAGPGASLAADFGIEMVFVEGGTFQMGATSEQGSDAYGDEKPVHSVTLSDFYIGKYEVTQAQWKAVMGKNPSHFTGKDNRPVENVSWEDMHKFIKKLNQLTGKRYRLPTEAEWEYAARGGKKSQGYKYAGGNSIDKVAWYRDNSGDKTHPVGKKQPNELGLYDMSGNVYEWCQDWYGDYSSSAQTNPTGPSRGSDRVLRGGGLYSFAGFCRVAHRDPDNPSDGSLSSGFRLVLEVSSSQENPEVDPLETEVSSSQENPEVGPLETLEQSMVFVEGGTFQMGATSEQGSDAHGDEKPVHSVTLSDFYIGKYEVTQAQWKAVMGSNPSHFTGYDNRPVEEVSWKDVQKFIKKLNQLTGKRYRLPTEAEWEYAAQGGKKSQGYKYAGSNTIDEVAWYCINSSDQTDLVGQKQPNELGLYDMSGNVSEWCQDWYNRRYDSYAQTNPTGPSRGSDRVLRGGNWNFIARGCRVTGRHCSDPSSRDTYIGFRLVEGELPPQENPEGDPLEALAESMVIVEGGTFQMGATSEQGWDPYDDEKPVHSVTLSDFYIGKYEVTQAQWKAVMGENSSGFRGDYNLPVEDVSWEDVQKFIKKLNRLTGKRYRLPTEAEWEYAARGGKKSQGYKYAGSNTIEEVAWYEDNSGDKTHPVGKKQPNELGLYDMSGNVDEWCQDRYGSYDSSAQTNPTGPSRGSQRVCRGGSCSTGASLCRVTDRDGTYPSLGFGVGFRLVLLP